jgi:hypothetical protein
MAERSLVWFVCWMLALLPLQAQGFSSAMTWLWLVLLVLALLFL